MAQSNAMAGLGGLGKFTELRSRLTFVLLALIVYRIGSYIPVPGVDTDALPKCVHRIELQLGAQQAQPVRRHDQPHEREEQRQGGGHQHQVPRAERQPEPAAGHCLSRRTHVRTCSR